jgi:hypothetical protein
MADRYWVGGTANWDGTAGTKWALTSGGAGGQAAPTSADDVFFDAASGAVTVTAGTGWSGSVRSINCTGFTGTFSFNNLALSVATNFTLSSGMTFTAGTRLTLTGTGTLTPAGKTFNAITINAPASTVTLGGALTCNADLVISQGTFTTSASNYSVTATNLSSSNANTRTITLNGSTVTLSVFGTPLDFTTTTGLTFTAGTSSIVCTGGIAYFSGGGMTFNNVSFTAAAVSDGQIRGANTFAQLTLTAPSTSGLSLYSFDSNQTITTLVAAGASAIRRVFLYSNTPGTRRTLTVTTWSSILDVDFRDIGMNTSRSGTRLGDCGNNNNVTFVAPKTVYWNLTGSQSWSSTGWATTSGGTPAVNNFPLAQDTAVFDNTGAATTVDINSSFNIGSVNMSARTSPMTMTGGSAHSVYGDWTTGSGVTLSFTNAVRFAKTGTQTLTSAGKSFFGVNVSGPSSLVLADALVTTTTGIQSLFVQGSIDAVSYSVTSDFFTGNANVTTALGTGTWTITGVLSGNGPWTQSGGTVTGSAEIILSNTTTGARTFAGGGKTYGKLTIGGATGTSTLTITGANTFSEIASTKTVAHTIVFPNVTTTVGAFTVQGSSGNVVTLSRTGASGTFTLAKSGGGIVGSNFLSISNSTASPSNTWYAGANSTDGGGNTGWIFANAPGGGSFIAFFM